MHAKKAMEEVTAVYHAIPSTLFFAAHQQHSVDARKTTAPPAAAKLVRALEAKLESVLAPVYVDRVVSTTLAAHATPTSSLPAVPCTALPNDARIDTECFMQRAILSQASVSVFEELNNGTGLHVKSASWGIGDSSAVFLVPAAATVDATRILADVIAFKTLFEVSGVAEHARSARLDTLV